MNTNEQPDKLEAAGSPPDRGVEFSPGVFADHVLRAEGWSWLEDYYGLPIATMASEWSKHFGYLESLPIFVALLKQRDPAMSDREAFRLVRGIGKWDLAQQMLDLGSIGIDIGGEVVPAGERNLQLRLREDQK